MNQKIYDRLQEIAKSLGTITYSDIAPLANLSMDNEDDRNAISIILEEIAKHEESNQRPMLTAVVIHREDNIPGEGFFQIAQKFARYNGSRNQNNRLRFWIDALNSVHEYWKEK